MMLQTHSKLLSKLAIDNEYYWHNNVSCIVKNNYVQQPFDSKHPNDVNHNETNTLENLIMAQVQLNNYQTIDINLLNFTLKSIFFFKPKKSKIKISNYSTLN